jgi:serine/threonine protein kinase
MGSKASKAKNKVKNGGVQSATAGSTPPSSRDPSARGGSQNSRRNSLDREQTLKNVRKVQDVYEMKSVLGTGGYAVVWGAVHKRTRQEYAIKVMKATSSSNPNDDEVSVDEIRNEIEVMKRIEHPNIVHVREYFVQNGKFYIVMGWLKGGELLDALLDLGNYTEQDAKVIARQLLEALSYMHVNNVIHRDLKLENLLLARPNDISSVVIADFGLARKAVNARQVFTTQCGTPSYVAPEILLGQSYTPAVDVWSMGVILYTLLIGSFPYAHSDQQTLFRIICSGKFQTSQPEWEQIGPEVKDLLRGLLCVDVKERLTAADALNHAWFTADNDASSKNLKASRARLHTFADSMKLQVKTFEPGAFLVRQGELGHEVYLIREGTCDVTVANANGSVSKVATRGKGDFIGEMAVSSEDGDAAAKPRTASVRAVDFVSATVLSKADMQWAVDHDYSLEGEIRSVIEARRAELDDASHRGGNEYSPDGGGGGADALGDGVAAMNLE